MEKDVEAMNNLNEKKVLGQIHIYFNADLLLNVDY